MQGTNAMTIDEDDGFAERRAMGRSARQAAHRSSHGVWRRVTGIVDPVDILQSQAESRVPELVPIRYGRMRVSPFAFYRGGAAVMAADLSSTPHSGLTVQLCGDAHLSNFGLFGTAERNLAFDINDFDETHPGPWEWDLKRLAASFEVADRGRGFSPAERRSIVLEVVRTYRTWMLEASRARVLDSWYDHFDSRQVLDIFDAEQKADRIESTDVKRMRKLIAKAYTRDSLSATSKLVERKNGALRIRSDPPLIVPVEELVASRQTRERDADDVAALLAAYRVTLSRQHHPLSNFSYLHMARKVVGVGSVGTRAWIILMRGRNDDDLLMLQAKEAQRSVLEPYTSQSLLQNQGERVVTGQRLMQASTDIFLGWKRLPDVDGRSRDFYIRQLRDWKGAIDPDRLTVATATVYAHLCAQALARAHARTGDRVAIAGYLGRGDVFDRAMAAFASSYADQNQRDYELFLAAIESGRIEATSGL
jgi:uncharacterized protein (DUF2252 family)